VNEFQIFNGDTPVEKFEHTTDPYNAKQCVDLLKRYADANGIDRAKAKVVTYQNGRKARTFRAM